MPNGLLRLSGFVPTKPQQVNFEMLFQNMAGRWRLFGIAVNTSLAKAPTGAPAKNDWPKVDGRTHRET